MSLIRSAAIKPSDIAAAVTPDVADRLLVAQAQDNDSRAISGVVKFLGWFAIVGLIGVLALVWLLVFYGNPAQDSKLPTSGNVSTTDSVAGVGMKPGAVNPDQARPAGVNPGAVTPAPATATTAKGATGTAGITTGGAPTDPAAKGGGGNGAGAPAPAPINVITLLIGVISSVTTLISAAIGGLAGLLANTRSGSQGTKPAPTAGGTPPGQPPNLTAAAGRSGLVTLSWEMVPGATGYTIYRSTSPGTTPTPLQHVVAHDYDDTTVTSGQSYSYRVAALSGATEGAMSPEVAVTVP